MRWRNQSSTLKFPHPRLLFRRCQLLHELTIQPRLIVIRPAKHAQRKVTFHPRPRTALQPQVASIAAPPVVCRAWHKQGPDRVQVDVSRDFEQVGISIHEVAVEAALIELADPLVATVEISRVARTKS